MVRPRPQAFEVGVDKHSNQLFERCPGRPAELVVGFEGITDEIVELSLFSKNSARSEPSDKYLSSKPS